jgi:hypothetical protein
LSNTIYKTDIGLPYGKLKPFISWCEVNCVDEWTVDFTQKVASNGTLYTFCFNSEADYINFLIWKK